MGVLLGKWVTIWALGAVLMLVLSFTVYRRSYYYQKAQSEMRGEASRPGIGSRVVTAGILLIIILFFTLADLWLSSGRAYAFGTLLALNLVLISLLSLFDALFIDIFLLLVWRPAFWRLPPGQPTRARMLQHIRGQFTAGWLFKIPIAVLAAGLSLYLRSRL